MGSLEGAGPLDTANHQPQNVRPASHEQKLSPGRNTSLDSRWNYVEEVFFIYIYTLSKGKEDRQSFLEIYLHYLQFAHLYAKTQVGSGTFGIWHYQMQALYLNMQLHQVWLSKHDRASLLASSQPFPSTGRHRSYKWSVQRYIHPLASLEYGLRDPWGLKQ